MINLKTGQDEVRLRLLPIKIFLPFLIFTEFLVWVGPIVYPIENNVLLLFYFAILNLALYWGYKSGMKRSSHSSCRVPNGWISTILIVGLLASIYTMIIKWQTKGIGFSLDSLINALINPGEAYMGEANDVVEVSTLSLLVSPIRWAAIPLGIYYWKKLNSFFKLIVISTMLVYIFTWLGIGTRKGIFDLMVFGFFLVCAQNKKLITNPSSYRKTKIICFTSLIIFLLYFVFSNLSRSGLESFNDLTEIARFEYRDIYKDNLPEPLVIALGEISSYLCQGYYALSLGLSIGILPITIFGSSWATAQYISRFWGYNPTPDTYIASLEQNFGIDRYEHWHSIYLWLANDFSFIGVPIVIFIIGYLCAKIWNDCLYGRNPFAYPVFAFMILMIFYFFANNQVLSFSLEPFVGCVILYIISKH